MYDVIDMSMRWKIAHLGLAVGGRAVRHQAPCCEQLGCDSIRGLSWIASGGGLPIHRPEL